MLFAQVDLQLTQPKERSAGMEIKLEGISKPFPFSKDNCEVKSQGNLMTLSCM